MVEVDHLIVENLQLSSEESIMGRTDEDYEFSCQTWFDDVSGTSNIPTNDEIKLGQPSPRRLKSKKDDDTEGPKTVLYDQPLNTEAETFHPVVSVSDAVVWHDSPEAAQVEVTVPTDKVGLIIGRRGRTIKSLQERTRTKMQIIQGFQYENPNNAASTHKTLVITGSSEAVVEAEQLVLDLISKAPPLPPLPMQPPIQGMMNPSDYPEGPRPPPDQRYDHAYAPSSADAGQGNGSRMRTTRFPVPKVAVGLIIGKGGETIKRIRSETGAKVQFNPLTGSAGDTEDQMATVVGRPEQIRHAYDLINDLVSTVMNSGYKTESHGPIRNHSWSEYYASPADSDHDIDEDCGRDSHSGSRIQRNQSKSKAEYYNSYESAPSPGASSRYASECSSKGYRGHNGRQRESFRARPSSNFWKGNVDESRYYVPAPNDKPYYSGQEWGQGDPGIPWNPCWGEDSQYVQPMGLNDYYMNIPTGGDYSNWVQYFPAVGYPPPPTAAPDGTSNAAPPVISSPVPIMSATIVQHPNQAAPYAVGPPKIYLSVPTTAPPGQTAAAEDTTQLDVAGSSDVKLSKTDEDSSMSTDSQERKGEDKVSEPRVESKLEGSAEQPKSSIDSDSKPVPQPIPEYGYPTNLGAPGSSTRIVSFYYDMNANSIVIMNQWQFC